MANALRYVRDFGRAGRSGCDDVGDRLTEPTSRSASLAEAVHSFIDKAISRHHQIAEDGDVLPCG